MIITLPTKDIQKKGVPLVVKKLLKKYQILYEPWYNVAGCGKSYLLFK